jgi:large subunit ribosomal protein L32e
MAKTKTQLLALRRAMKAKKPGFARDESYKRKRLSVSWRKPKGMHAKLRLHLNSAGRFVSPGFGSPAEVSGLDRSGLEPVMVSNPSQLDVLDAKLQGAIISTSVGAKKRVAILERAKEKKVSVLNVKNAESYIKSIKDGLGARKKSAEKRSQERLAKDAKKPEPLDKKVEKVDSAAAPDTVQRSDHVHTTTEGGKHDHHDHKHSGHISK